MALKVAPCTKAAEITLPPLTLPVAVTTPAVRRLPPVTLPAALRADPPVLATATVVLAEKVTVPLAADGPMVMVVVEPSAPPVPKLIVLVLPADTAPAWRLVNCVAVLCPRVIVPVVAVPPRINVPLVWLVPRSRLVVVPEKVTAPVALKVTVCTRALDDTFPPLTLPPTVRALVVALKDRPPVVTLATWSEPVLPTMTG